jgi:hypothetical protein
MSRSDKRGKVHEPDPLNNRETVDTTKALIELYKSAFGERWKEFFSETVVVGIGDH